MACPFQNLLLDNLYSPLNVIAQVAQVIGKLAICEQHGALHCGQQAHEAE